MLNMLLPRQSKAARALLDWNQADLAKNSGVSLGTVKDFESGRHQLNAKALGDIARAYQKAGLILFFEDDTGDVGVRLKKKADGQ
jgi:transcriptional regulator with XRE-family HTH domain